MARGGFRPGAGRKPGSKDAKQRKKPEPSEVTKIRQMLKYNIKAKAKFYQEFF